MSDSLMFPKRSFRPSRRVLWSQHYRKWRPIVRAEAYARDGGRCRLSDRPLVLEPADARHAFEIAHINEEPRRSKGGDPTNRRDCVTLSPASHAAVTAHTIRIEYLDPERRA